MLEQIGQMLTSAFANSLLAAAEGNIRGEPLANDVGSEQTLNIGKAGQIEQKVVPSPGSAVSSVTSAHDVTR